MPYQDWPVEVQREYDELSRAVAEATRAFNHVPIDAPDRLRRLQRAAIRQRQAYAAVIVWCDEKTAQGVI